MPKWEYLLIVCEEEYPRYVNGKEIPNWQQGETIFEVVGYLFRKGWESVSISHPYFAWRGYPKTPLVFRRYKK